MFLKRWKTILNKSTIIAVIGPFITILTLGGTMIYTQGGISERIESNQKLATEKIESNEKGVDDNSKKIMTNRNKAQEIEVGQASIESKLDLLIKMMEEEF